MTNFESFIPPNMAPLVYGGLNIAASTGIVFANKAVFSTFGFHFPYALTFLHTVCTMFGMQGFLNAGFFEAKSVPKMKIVPLAVAYVAYIVLSNINLKMNPVGFYQITKIAVAPAVLVIDWIFYNKRSSASVTASVAVVCLGVALAMVSDTEVASKGIMGILVGIGHILSTSMYQIWAGEKQRELSLNSSQLLHEYVPIASPMLGTLVLILEPIGWTGSSADTVLGYDYAPTAVIVILVSSVLGLLVTLSTFLMIGATSSLTYNVVGHIKTAIVVAGGVFFFGEAMPPKKLLGICIAMGGIIMYSFIKMQETRAGLSTAASFVDPKAIKFGAEAEAELGEAKEDDHLLTKDTKS